MATVADIEPASLAVTPGQAEVFTLSVRNDGDDVEAYHLSSVDEAAGLVVIEPDTLLVHPGETGTATATITLEHTGRWPVGELIVRFHIVPAGQPEEFLVVEAIATVQSFSDVAAVLSPPALEGRRSAEAEIAIANAGNAHVYANVAVSAGELTVSIDHAQAALSANSTESIDLRVRANGLLWRGDPVPHPFVVTVTPEDQSSISLEGTFTQLPLLPSWTFKALIGVAAAAALLLVLWLGAVFWGGLGGTPAETVAATPTETPTPTPVPVAVDVAFDLEDDDSRAGDPVVANVEVDADGAPEGAYAAVAVEWPDELTLDSSTCEGWVGPEIDRQLRGEPRSGDECLVDLEGAGGEGRSSGEVELTFTTPPAGFAEEVSATVSRIVTIEDEDAEVVAHDMAADSDDELAVAIEVQPYPFWLDVAVDPLWVPPGEARPVTITVHRTPPADGPDENAVMTFDLAVPGFADLAGVDGCDGYDDENAECTLQWYDYEPYSVTAFLEVPEGLRDAGVVTATGVTYSGTLQSLQPTGADSIQGGEAFFVTGDDLFPVTVAVEPNEAAPGDAVRARIEVGHAGFPTGVESLQGGTWALGIRLAWPTSLFLAEPPRGCSYLDGVCSLRGPEPGETSVIELSFRVTDLTFQSGDVAASGATLTHDPSTEDDRHDGRTQPAVGYPPEWIGSGAAEFSPF